MSNLTTAGPASKNGSTHANGARDATGSAGDTSGLSQTLQGHVDDIRSLIQCGICMRPLYEPFTLVCGHTFCYTCLTSWFSGGRSNKTCPDCRAPVKSEPSPAYLVRSVVQLFTTRAELLDKGETTAEHIHHQREEAAKIESDKSNPHPREGGLFKGTFSRTRLPAARPVVDLEDGVVRCPNCAWELEDDSNCMQCGYRQDEDSFSDASDYLSDPLDENSEMTDYLDDEAEDGFNGTDDFDYNDLYDGIPAEALPFDIQHLYDVHRNYPHQPRPALPLASSPQGRSDDWDGHSVSTAAYDNEGDGYLGLDDTDMDSFIDDGENYDSVNYDSESDRSTVVGAPDNSTQDHYREFHDYSDIPTSPIHDLVGDGMSGITHTTDSDDDSDDSDDNSDDDSDGSDEGDDDDDSDDDEPIRPAVNGSRSRQRPNPWTVQISSSPTQPWPINSNVRPAQSRTTSNFRNPASAGSSAANAISLEDDSDEGPVGPTRRRVPRGSGGRGRL